MATTLINLREHGSATVNFSGAVAYIAIPVRSVPRNTRANNIIIDAQCVYIFAKYNAYLYTDDDIQTDKLYPITNKGRQTTRRC